MKRPQPLSGGVNKKYIVTSPAGIKAVEEKIRLITQQAEAATLDESRDIYMSVVVMMQAMLDAGTEGVMTAALLREALAQHDLSPLGQDDAIRILTGHMAQVRETVSKQQ